VTSLESLRGEVERLTMALLEAAAKRTALARRIGLKKKLGGLELRDAIREACLMKRAARRARPLGLGPSFVKEFMGLLFDEALEAQGRERERLPAFFSRAELLLAHELAPLLAVDATLRLDATRIEREAASALSAELGLDVEPQRVVLMHTRPMALCLALLATLERGDVVHVLEPAPRLYALLCTLAGGRCVEVPSSPARGWAPELGLLAQQISPATRLILIGSPQIPPGRLYREGELRELARLTSEHGALLLSDESCAGLAGLRFRSALSFAEDVLVCSCLRLKGKGGVLPYLVAPPPIAKKVRALRDLLAPFRPELLLAMAQGSRASSGLRSPLRPSLEGLAPMLEKRGVFVHRPEVGALVFVELRGKKGLQELLLGGRFIVIQGSSFGPYADFVALYVRPAGLPGAGPGA
jgi:chorismate mutase